MGDISSDSQIHGYSMIRRKVLVTVLLFLLWSPVLYGQFERSLSTKSKKAIELFNEAQNNYTRRNFSNAIRLYSEAINKDKKFVEAYIQLGTCYRYLGDKTNAMDNWKKAEAVAIENGTENTYPVLIYYIGELYLESGEYETSINYLERSITNVSLDPKRKTHAKLLLNKAEFAMENMAKPIPFSPQPVSGIVNRFAMQYFPVLTADQTELFFTRRLGYAYTDDEDIHVSKRGENGEWTRSTSISDNINTKYNEGTCSVSADGRTLIFTSCEGRNSFGSCDLFVSYKQGNDWSEPKNMGSAINSRYWESQPSLSADGNTIFFVSDRPGGVGRRDIYVSSRRDGVWSKPKNLGEGINTVEDEVSPFIHVNNQTLYFASEGLPGFGSFDIYVTELDDYGNWKDPQNLGYPLNDFNEQTSLFITSDGLKGYYSNQVQGSNPSSLIYEFEVPREIKVTNRSTFVKGIVYDSETKIPLKASIELYDLNTEQRIYDYESDSTDGKYLMILTQGSEYALYTSAPGYLFKSEFFNYEGDQTAMEPIYVDIALDPIKPGTSTTLNNIFFETNEYELTDRSKIELNRVVDFMNQNPDTRVVIEGHTDNQGEKVYNKDLSNKRAKSVYDYILDSGIDQNQLSFAGFGSDKPVDTNDTEEGRAMNRRIEFRILE